MIYQMLSTMPVLIIAIVGILMVNSSLEEINEKEKSHH